MSLKKAIKYNRTKWQHQFSSLRWFNSPPNAYWVIGHSYGTDKHLTKYGTWASLHHALTDQEVDPTPLPFTSLKKP